MSLSRIVASAVDTSVLGESLVFRHGKTARNRIMKSPLSEKMYNWSQHSEDRRGVVTEEILNLYSKWGNGGFGIILTGNLGVDPKNVGEAGQGMVTKENTNDDSRNSLRKLAHNMKADGSLAIAQTNHIGARAVTGYTDSAGNGCQIVDVVANPIGFTTEKLQESIFDRFAFAASVLHESGFDGMELHSSHGMIFNQFLDAKNNTRGDDYGGSIDNRARLLTDTYHAIRKSVPESTGFAVGVKLNSRDFQESGMSRDEIIRVCELIEETGFDFVELTGGAMESVIKEVNMRESTIAREDFFLDFVQFTSKIFKKTVVYITGRWQTANAMVSSVNMGLTKGVGMGRWSCAEPDFPQKLIAGETFSCPDIKFAPSEFLIAKNAAHFQMKQMAENSFDKSKGCGYGITDFTVGEETDHFRKACAEYMVKIKTMGGQDNHAGVIDYVPLKN